MYLMSPWASQGALSLPQTCEIAHEHGVPVLVDAAAMLPPTTSLTRFIAEGADLVTFSGGKGLMGPQSSGILAGRADLIRAARLNGSPNHSVGRAAKAAKEDIVGLIVALEDYLRARPRRRHGALARRRRSTCWSASTASPASRPRTLYDGREHIRRASSCCSRRSSGIDAHELVLAMEEHDPRIFLFEPTGPSAKPNSIVINTQTMQPGEEKIVAEVLRPAIRQRLTNG